MVDIVLTIPNEKIEYMRQGFLKIYPNGELIKNPAYIDEIETPNEPEFLDQKKYTDQEWFKEVLKRKIIKDVKRGHELIAYKNIKIEEDKDLVN
jgi:hypothetical protein